jgi:N-methylhydantoinase A/oxoprolinase/acetone carboxylase beta subunit
MPPLRDLRLGIDVGGTHTDAIVVDGSARLLAKAKVPTTAEASPGIAAAIDRVLGDPAVDAARIGAAMLGTTHATNAVVERRGLGRVAVVRIGSGDPTYLPPLADWPDGLRGAVSAGELVVTGGVDFDARRRVRFDAEAVQRFLAPLAGRVDAVAVTSAFAAVDEGDELRTERIARELLGDVHVSLSHELAGLGLLERENATVLNAALVGVADRVAAALVEALRGHGLRATTYFAQNDGTLMAFEYALRHPVLTIGSGPANSFRGAAHLTGLEEALVCDVGGTSTDVGVLANGFPRESTAPIRIGDVETSFRMPDLVALGLGGGTVVEPTGGEPGIGPRSVGHALHERALVFGGTTPTLTDAAVWAGRIDLGDRALARRARVTLERALRRSDELLAEAVDRAKTRRGALPLAAVGGGAFLVPEGLPGATRVVRPEHFEVANAIGAAIASAAGFVERIAQYGPAGRATAIEDACRAACDRAVQAGADPRLVQVVDIDESPLSYLNDPAVRVRVKAAGPLAAATVREAVT